jgi:uncharacterized protein (TIGR02246 family)
MEGAVSNAEIESMFGEWLEASNRGGEAGAEGYASYCTDDAVWLPPNESRINGRAGVQEMVKAFTHADDFSVTFSPTDIDVLADGRTAHAIGVYALSMKDDDGNEISDRGKFFDVLARQDDGSWRCSVAMWNSDLSPAG